MCHLLPVFFIVFFLFISIRHSHRMVCEKETVIWRTKYIMNLDWLLAHMKHIFNNWKLRVAVCRWIRQFHHNGKWIEYLSLYTRRCNTMGPEFEWICFIADGAHFCNVVVISISEMRWLATVLLAYKWNKTRERESERKNGGKRKEICWNWWWRGARNEIVERD